MYTEFYGLKGPPFQLTPDHRFYFASTGHARAMSYLTYGLHQGEGFIVITGDIGAGKTTLVSRLLSTLDRTRYVAANVVTTQLGPAAVLRMVATAFGVDPGRGDKTTLLWRLEDFFTRSRAAGRRSVLLVDEAQNLSTATLEELRMLSNFEVAGEPALQSFLLGQPQFRYTLARRELGQLRQRIIASYHLGPMGADDTARYVRHRLAAAGWTDDPRIDDAALAEVHRYTSGVPRRINVLCTRLLLYGFLEEVHTLDAAVVRQVGDELQRETAQVLDPGGPREAPAARRAPAAAPRPAPQPEPPPAEPRPVTSTEVLRRVEALEAKVRQHNRMFIRTLKTVAGYLEGLSARAPENGQGPAPAHGPARAPEHDRRVLADRRAAAADRRRGPLKGSSQVIFERRSAGERRRSGDRRRRSAARLRLAHGGP